MRLKYRYLWLTAAFLLLGGAVFQIASPHKTVHAQATTATFTATSVATSAGVAIVDQSTGAITYCAAEENINGTTVTPEGTCRAEGRASVGTGTASLSLAVTSSTFYVINNQSGAIWQCPAVNIVTNGNPEPEGSCVYLAAAAQ